MQDLERQIHEVLFPAIEFNWIDYCRTHNLDPNVPSLDDRWINAKCDVQALWCHIHNGRQVFVTNDGNFHLASKKPKLIALKANRIEHPTDAADSEIRRVALDHPQACPPFDGSNLAPASVIP